MPTDLETRASKLDEEVAEALTEQLSPILELSYDVRRTLDDHEPGTIHDGVGRVTAYRVGGGHVVDERSYPEESRWYAVASERLPSLVRELAGSDEGWAVEGCALSPEPAWLSRYD